LCRQPGQLGKSNKKALLLRLQVFCHLADKNIQLLVMWAQFDVNLERSDKIEAGDSEDEAAPKCVPER